MKTILSILLIIIGCDSYAQSYKWAKSIGGTSNDFSYSIAIDASNNVYITGTFRYTADFDPGTDTAYLTAVNNYEDIFIAKYDTNGNYIWAKSIGGTSNDYSYCIAVDVNNNVYITGSFRYTVDFDPGPGTANLIAVNNYKDGFFAKYDTYGNYLWAKNIGGTSEDYSNCIAVDTSNNVYITGTFRYTVDFDPGPGTANLIAVNEYEDGFFAKYDTYGNYLWAKSIGGTYRDYSYSIAVDTNNNVYIIGTFDNTVDFDPGPDTANITAAYLNGDVFFAKYDTDGNYQWAKNIYSNYYDFMSYDFQRYYSITTGNNNVYLTGGFSNTVDFDPGPNTANLTSSGGVDIFFAKYDINGNYQWVKSIGGTSYDYSYGIIVDTDDFVYITGYFSNIVDFNPGLGTANLTSINQTKDVFFAKYSQQLNIISQPNDTAICIGNNISFSVYAESPPLTYEWRKNGNVISGADSSVYEITSASLNDEGIYSCIISSNIYGTDTINAALKVIDLSVNAGIDVQICNGQSTILTATGNSNHFAESEPYIYSWTPTTGLNSSDIYNPTANPDSTTDYIIDITDQVGCTASDQMNVFVQHVFQDEEICLVTVDTTMWKNKIMWEKNTDVGTGYYLIYRESGTNYYTQIGNVAYDQPGEFIDLFSAPESHGDKYKISVLDTCNHESEMSFYHKTVNLTISAFGSTMGLNWDDYIDESGNFVPFRYYIYRGTLPTNMALYDSVSGSFNSYNDNNVFTVYYYMIGVKKSPPCNINGSEMSFSNRKDNSTLVGIVEHNGFNSEALSIHPNPFKESTTIKFYNPDNNTFLLTLTDSKGRIVRIVNNVSGDEIIIERKDLKTGIYLMELKGESMTFRGKIMIE